MGGPRKEASLCCCCERQGDDGGRSRQGVRWGEVGRRGGELETMRNQIPRLPEFLNSQAKLQIGLLFLDRYLNDATRQLMEEGCSSSTVIFWGQAYAKFQSETNSRLKTGLKWQTYVRYDCRDKVYLDVGFLKVHWWYFYTMLPRHYGLLPILITKTTVN